MRKEYQDELDLLKLKMQKAEAFASRLPVFEKLIIERKLSGEEDWHKFGETYKKAYFGWGINRGFFRSGSQRTVCNFKGDDQYALSLWCIYINTYSMFDVHEKFDLLNYTKDVDLFWYDDSNTTFYCTDDNIESLLEALNNWYVDACNKVEAYKLELSIAKKERELAAQKQRVEELKEFI